MAPGALSHSYANQYAAAMALAAAQQQQSPRVPSFASAAAAGEPGKQLKASQPSAVSPNTAGLGQLNNGRQRDGPKQSIKAPPTHYPAGPGLEPRTASGSPAPNPLAPDLGAYYMNPAAIAAMAAALMGQAGPVPSLTAVGSPCNPAQPFAVYPPAPVPADTYQALSALYQEQVSRALVAAKSQPYGAGDPSESPKAKRPVQDGTAAAQSRSCDSAPRVSGEPGPEQQQMAAAGGGDSKRDTDSAGSRVAANGLAHSQEPSEGDGPPSSKRIHLDSSGDGPETEEGSQSGTKSPSSTTSVPTPAPSNARDDNNNNNDATEDSEQSDKDIRDRKQQQSQNGKLGNHVNTSLLPPPLANQLHRLPLLLVRAARAAPEWPMSENGHSRALGARLSPISDLASSFRRRPAKLEVCREFLRGACKRAERECKFAHPAAEQVAAAGQSPESADGLPQASALCVDFMRGRCGRGSLKCR